MDGVMAPVKGANCCEDVDKFLINLTATVPSATLPPPPVATQHDSILMTIPENVRHIVIDHCYVTIPEVFSLQEDNVITYIAGYIVRKLQSKVCVSCVNVLRDEIDSDNPSHDFLTKKLYKDAVVGLTVPSKVLVEVLTGVEMKYRQIIDTVMVGTNVMANLVTSVCNEVDLSSITCDKCNMERSIIGLMLRIRLHHSLKETNRHFANCDRKNRKLMKFSHA